jgi:predicted RNase H-like HicB family nuclease
VPTVAEERPARSKKTRKPFPEKGLILRCVVYLNKLNEYTAECIDLDIVAREKTAHEAFEELQQAVRGYLATAVNGDTKGLIPRPSPFSHRARYHIFALRAAFSIGLFSSQNRDFLVSDLAVC